MNSAVVPRVPDVMNIVFDEFFNWHNNLKIVNVIKNIAIDR